MSIQSALVQPSLELRRDPLSEPATEQAVQVKARYFFPDDQLVHLPDTRAAPLVLPAGAPIPRRSDVVYISSTSAWLVILVVHEWLSPVELQIQVWLEHAGHARAYRPEECKFTH